MDGVIDQRNEIIIFCQIHVVINYFIQELWSKGMRPSVNEVGVRTSPPRKVDRNNGLFSEGHFSFRINCNMNIYFSGQNTIIIFQNLVAFS